MIRDEVILIVEENIFKRETFNEVERICHDSDLDAIDAFQVVTMLQGYPSQMIGEASTILITADKKLAAYAKSKDLRVWDIMKETRPTEGIDTR